MATSVVPRREATPLASTRAVRTTFKGSTIPAAIMSTYSLLAAVETAVEVLGVLVSQLANNDGALETSVLNDGASRAGDGALDDADTELLVEVGGLDVGESRWRRP